MTATAERSVAPATTEAPRPRRPLPLRLLIGFLRHWLLFIVLILLWQWYTVGDEDPYFPPPTEIVGKMHDLWFSGPAWHLWLTQDAIDNVLPSIGRLLGGWAIASVIGVLLGMAIGRSPVLRDFVNPLVSFLRAVPAPLLLPVFMIIFKFGLAMQVATIAFGVVWPVLLNTADGAASVDKTQVDTARSFRIPRLQWLFGVVLPASLPKILSGLRIGLGLSLVLMVVSELVGTTNGIGYELLNAQQSFENAALWAGVVLIGILGNVLNGLLMLVERRALAWHGANSREKE
ncbi:ABC transporter permease [Labedaea rhizosphaerae]|uniref:ABC-type nitrate/sulfonate/bicarbonate transport system permease component n=1 Tax=Labedaea rhizosphaerae TaxID=598644 RepID=A0A4R6SJR1_LABRH|nr:ABC transporter permease [Labedaea rhizosphaerae]TDQ04566.1 ABC-type nitrate/sulfonate/bicarbonate transport system permease component [Labedaea rhizosphaerae]